MNIVRNIKLFFLKKKTIDEGYIFIDRFVDQHFSQEIIAKLLYFERKFPLKQLHIFIIYTGGFVNSYLAIYDTLKQIKTSFSVTVVGAIESLACIILFAAKPGFRYCTKDTRLSYLPNFLSSNEKEVEEKLNHSSEVYFSIILENTNIGKKDFHDAADKNGVLSLRQCLDLGLIDKWVNI